jgi:hypothetical protein
MQEQILLSRNGGLVRMPRSEWEAELAAAPQRIAARLEFMTPDHRRVREHVVRELPRSGAPITREAIAADLRIDSDRVAEILGDLERRLFFLVRRPEGAVSWAFPVTVDRTPHALAFDSGERCFAA